MNKIIGKAYCKYGEPWYERDHHIFNVGEYAIVVGNGGVYSNSFEYYSNMKANLDIAYLNCKEHQKELPDDYFIVGRRVEILNRCYFGSCGTKICLIEVDGWQFVISMDYLKPIKRSEEMNEIIVEMFPVTKEAILVDKWFGREIDKPIFKMLIKGKEKELIEEAQRMEKEKN